MLCEPTASTDVLSVAWAEPFNGALPSVMPPSRNVTVPVGIPVPPVTVAVNVTVCPQVEGFGDEVTALAVATRQARSAPLQSSSMPLPQISVIGVPATALHTTVVPPPPQTLVPER